VALFAVVLLVLIWAVGMLGVISPLVWLIITPLQIIVGAIPFVLFLSRVKRPGMISLFALAMAVFFLLSGNSLISSGGIVVLGVVADLISWTGHYRAKWASIWSYTVFSLGFLTPFIPMLIDRDAYFQSAVWDSMGQAYIEATDRLVTLPILGLLALSVIAAGFGGAVIGWSILRKHFVRAGLA
jgi:energy-coupling factor transport system substrate-specific component